MAPSSTRQLDSPTWSHPSRLLPSNKITQPASWLTAFGASEPARKLRAVMARAKPTVRLDAIPMVFPHFLNFYLSTERPQEWTKSPHLCQHGIPARYSRDSVRNPNSKCSLPDSSLRSGPWATPSKEETTMDKALYDRGMTMRRRVLGDEYVDRAVANTDDFNRQFQELLTTYCWGAVWGDDALKPRDRSILNLGMIACLGRMHEFEAHLRGALRNGLTPQELSAILRQIAVYCGFPAAVDCHRVAKQVLAAEAKKT